MRLERLNGPCPHIDKIGVFRKDLPAGVDSLKTPEQLAGERGLNPEFLKRLVAQLISLGGGSPLNAFVAGATSDDEIVARFDGAVAADGKAGRKNSPPGRLLTSEDGPFAAPKKPEPYFPFEVNRQLADLAQETQSLEAMKPPFVMAMGVQEGKPTNLRVHLRGSHLTLGDAVPRRFLEAVSGKSRRPFRRSAAVGWNWRSG